MDAAGPVVPVRNQLPRSRLFCGTLHDPSLDDYGTFTRGLADGTITYSVGQCERCPDTQRCHLQFFLCIRERRTLIGVKRLLFVGPRLQRVHLSVCQGTSAQNRTYCTKEESRDPAPPIPAFEIGIFADCPERNGQGSRTDLHGIAVRIRDGASLRDIAQDYPDIYCKYYRGFLALQQTIRCIPREYDPRARYAPPTVNWYYGRSGSGKSRQAYTEALADPLRRVYTKPPDSKWFDSYNGHDTIILDDYRGSWFSFGFLLRLLDVYPIQVECKGSMIPLCADIFYITCPLRPEQLYANLANREQGRIQQLLRRITTIRLFGEEPEFEAPPAAMYAGFNRG